MRKPSLAVLAVVLATTLAACGESSASSAYIEQVTKAQQGAELDASRLTTDVAAATTPGTIADTLNAFGASMRTNADELKAIKPPEKVAAEHQKYVDALYTFGTSLQALAANAKKSSPDELKALLAQADALTSELSSSEQKIVIDINDKLSS